MNTYYIESFLRKCADLDAKRVFRQAANVFPDHIPKDYDTARAIVESLKSDPRFNCQQVDEFAVVTPVDPATKDAPRHAEAGELSVRLTYNCLNVITLLTYHRTGGVDFTAGNNITGRATEDSLILGYKFNPATDIRLSIVGTEAVYYECGIELIRWTKPAAD